MLMEYSIHQKRKHYLFQFCYVIIWFVLNMCHNVI